MDYRHLPDAPESVKYHGGYDPSDPPFEEPDEVDQADENSESELKQTSTKEITGIVSVLKYVNRRFGINE